MSMVHDNVIKSYQINFEDETLIFRTQYGTEETTDVIFTSYLAHIFHCEMKDSIIFSIEEHPVDDFLKDERETLEKRKGCAWPIMYDTTDDFLNYLQIHSYKAFFLSSTLGLFGWVLAKQMDITTKEL